VVDVTINYTPPIKPTVQDVTITVPMEVAEFWYAVSCHTFFNEVAGRMLNGEDPAGMGFYRDFTERVVRAFDAAGMPQRKHTELDKALYAAAAKRPWSPR
jgi:hypothetical protein